MIFDELNTAFRWYDSLDKQNRFKEYCETMCEYALMSPCNDLLPFQIRTDSFGTPQSWTLIYLGDPITVPAIHAKAVFCLNEAGTGFTIAVNGFTIASEAMLATMAATVNSLVSQIIAGGILSSFARNNCVYIIAPAGVIWNGVPTTFGTSYGMIAVSASGTFEGASDATTGNTIDITTCIPFLNTYNVDDKVYVQYNGGDLPGCLPQQMECGKWYSEISDGTDTIYSEVFEVMPISDIDFEQSKLPLFSAWRWYDSKAKQTRYKEYCENLCIFYLLSGNNNLLPFQIKATQGAINMQSWTLVGIDEDCEFILDISLLSVVATIDGYRIIYNGDDIDLPCGKFYSVLNDGVTVWYSELIEIVNIIPSDEVSYLLQETGFKILQETGFGILLP